MLSTNPTVGCDVEFAAKKLNDEHNLMSLQYIPLSEDMLKGTKESPYWIDDLSFQRDNVFSEIGMLPANNKDEFVSRIVRAKDQLNILLEKHHLVYGSDSHVSYNPKVLKSIENYDSIGCDPDYDVWELCENPSPLLDELGSTRTCGGHIHIGYPDYKMLPPTDIDRINLTKSCDVFIGLWLKGTGRLDSIRQKFYGKAGAHRPKEYGIEYRVPSNNWACDDQVIGQMYDHVLLAFKYHDDIDEYINILGGNEVVIDMINEASQDEAYDAAIQVAAV